MGPGDPGRALGPVVGEGGAAAARAPGARGDQAVEAPAEGGRGRGGEAGCTVTSVRRSAQS